MRIASLLSAGLGIFAVGWIAGCGRALDSGAAAPKAPEPVATEKEADFVDEPVAEVQVPTQGVSIFFPGGGSFVREGNVGSWTTLKHRKMGARLSVWHRSARRTVTPAECEQEAGRSLRVLREPVVELLSEGDFRARGYFGTSAIELMADGSGRVVVHAAGLSRCLSLVFWDPKGSTTAFMLELVSEKFFPTVQALSVDDRVRSDSGSGAP